MNREDLVPKARYLLSGGATFLVEYVSLLAFSYGLHLDIHLALTLSFLLALVLGFLINHLWTFERHDADVSRRFVAYTVLALVNLGFNLQAVPWLGHLGVPYAVGKLAAQACVVVWNYVIMSRLIFRGEGVDRD